MLISALTGEGIEALLAAIDARFGGKDEILTLEIPAGEGRLLSWLHDNAEVLDQETAESGAVTARFRIDPTIRGKLDGQLKRAGLCQSLMVGGRGLAPRMTRFSRSRRQRVDRQQMRTKRDCDSVYSMTRLETAIAKLRELPAEEQEHVAELIMVWTSLAQRDVFRLSDDERAAVRVGLEQAKRGEFVPDDEMERFWQRNRA